MKRPVFATDAKSGPPESRAFSEDKFQFCSGILLAGAQRPVESLKSIPQGLKPILLFCAFAARRKRLRKKAGFDAKAADSFPPRLKPVLIMLALNGG